MGIARNELLSYPGREVMDMTCLSLMACVYKTGTTCLPLSRRSSHFDAGGERLLASQILASHVCTHRLNASSSSSPRSSPSACSIRQGGRGKTMRSELQKTRAGPKIAALGNSRQGRAFWAPKGR